jgi:tetratricopeptide (TPR) repeat protein
MPKIDLMLSAHAAQTDHRIVRQRGKSNDNRPALSDSEFFFAETRELPNIELRRALALSKARGQSVGQDLLAELQDLCIQIPDDGFLAMAAGAAALSRNDYQTGLAQLKRASLYPQTEELSLEILYQVAYRAHDWPSALAATESLLRVNPQHSQALAIRADTLLLSGQLEAAIATAQRALEANPSMLELHSWLSSAYQRQGKLLEAQREKELFERMRSAIPPASDAR